MGAPKRFKLIMGGFVWLKPEAVDEVWPCEEGPGALIVTRSGRELEVAEPPAQVAAALA